MKIICNGKEMAVEAGLVIEKLVTDLDLDPAAVVVECDGRIVLRPDYSSFVLQEGCTLELIRFVGGG